MKKAYNVVDMFCGAGGESTGIMQAAQEQGMKVNLTAINHWERAIETHAANHPGAEHLCESVERIDPARAVPGQRLDLLWASPECTHHSNARGGRPRSDQGRASAWLILTRWIGVSSPPPITETPPPAAVFLFWRFYGFRIRRLVARTALSANPAIPGKS